MRQTYSMEYEALFITRGGRVGKRSKAIASRNGKYYKHPKYTDKRRMNKRENLPKEMTKSYSRLTQELDQLNDYQRNLTRLCEEYDMYLEEHYKEQKRQEDEEQEEEDMYYLLCS